MGNPESRPCWVGTDFVSVFFLNNDISALRRMRIQRAQEYGATWAKEWGDNITHVIVDNNLVFQDLLSYLKLESLPVSQIVLVSCSLLTICRKALCALMNVTLLSALSFAQF